MKKLLFSTLFLSTLLVGCAENEAFDDDLAASKMKESEVFIYSGGKQLNKVKNHVINPKDEVGYSIPDDGKYLVYYYIRIDGNIPGEEECNFPASEYFPRTETYKTMISDDNHGYVAANVEWKQNFKFEKYVYSTDGSAVQSIILEEPSIEQLLMANKGKGDDFSGLLANKDNLHFIWYICKKQNVKDHVWHIDGILTTKDRTDVSQTDYAQDLEERYPEDTFVKDNGSVLRPAHVELDVHQQEHKDWNEIKTSIHLRDTVAVEVFLPIDYQTLADDFDMRAGVDYEYITELKDSRIKIGDQYYDMEVSITHEETGTRIQIQPNKEALIAARKLYDDGITFEIHSYVSPEVPSDVVWEKVKKTTYSVSPFTTVFGQITSAYYDDMIDIK